MENVFLATFIYLYCVSTFYKHQPSNSTSDFKCIYSIENTSFPFMCPYLDGVSRNVITNKGWVECKRFDTSYFESLSLDIYYRKPRIPFVNGFHNCAVHGSISSLPCESVGLGICYYDSQNPHTFCNAYEKICYGRKCACQTKQTRQHFCQGICTQIHKHNCSKCDDIFNQYGTPVLKLMQDNGSLLLNITAHLKLKVLSHGYQANCVCDIRYDRANYIHSFGLDFLRYEVIRENNFYQLYRLTPLKSHLVVPTRFWCEGFEYPNMNFVKSNTIIANFTEFAYDFVIKLFIDNVELENHLTIEDKLLAQQSSIVFRTVDLLPIDASNPLRQGFILHATFKDTSLSETAAYNILEKIVAGNFKYEYILNSQLCMEETTSIENETFTWPKSLIGTTTEYRLNTSKSLITYISRQCIGSFVYGAFWSELFYTWNKINPVLSLNENLEDLLHSNCSTEELNSQLSQIYKNYHTFEPNDIFLTAQIIDRIASEDGFFSIDTLIETISDIMVVNRTVLVSSQLSYGATDLILKSFDKSIVKAMQFVASHSWSALASNVAVQVLNLNSSYIYTIIFLENNEGNITIQILREEDSLKDMNKFEIAVHVPRGLQNQIINRVYNASVVAIAYKFDSFFNCGSNKHKIVAWCPSIFFPKSYQTAFVEPLRIYYHKNVVSNWSYCSFWHYNSSESDRSTWLHESSSTNEGHALLCLYNHTTSFALLTDNGSEDLYTRSQLVLNIITVIGCCLSMIGILGIFATTIIFKRWEDSGTKILINFSFSISFEMISLFLTGSIDVKDTDNSDICVFIGISLHYSLLAQFCWMFVISYLQYRRFVNCFADEPKHIVLKSCIFGWIFPALLVLPIPIINYKTYLNGEYCYLSGYYLKFGIFLPVCIIIFLNLLMFTRIFMETCFRSVKDGITTQMKLLHLKLQIRLAVFLFFLMGFTWIFGLLGTFLNSNILSYLFCLTGTLQGLVLFIFHIVLNKKIRTYWTKLICSLVQKQ